MKSDLIAQATVVYSNDELVLFVQPKNRADIAAGIVTNAATSSQYKTADIAADLKLANDSIITNSPAAVDKQGWAISASDRPDLSPTFDGFLDKESEVKLRVRSVIELWLPAHYTPDDIVLIESMPFTKHGEIENIANLFLVRVMVAVDKIICLDVS